MQSPGPIPLAQQTLPLQKEKVSKKRKVESDDESLQSLDDEKEVEEPGKFWIDKKRMRRVEVSSEYHPLNETSRGMVA